MHASASPPSLPNRLHVDPAATGISSQVRVRVAETCVTATAVITALRSVAFAGMVLV
jgi:hypothetical protein